MRRLLAVIIILAALAWVLGRDTWPESEGLVGLSATLDVPQSKETQGDIVRPLSFAPERQESRVPLQVVDSDVSATVVEESEDIVLRVRTLAREVPGSWRQPVPNVEVELTFTRARTNEPVVMRGTTNEDGEWLVRIAGREGPGAYFRGRISLRGKVTSPGYRQLASSAQWGATGSATHSLDLVAIRGVTIRGQVLNGLGQRVHASVSFRVLDGMRGTVSRRSARKLTTRGDGRFELHLEDGVSGTLFADAGEHGTGRLPDLSISYGDPLQDLVIVVSGSGVLRGQVTGSDGEPAPALSLLLCLADLDEEPGDSKVQKTAASRLDDEGGGRSRVKISTDEEGKFEVSGLRNAPFVVRAGINPGLFDASPFTRLLTDQPVFPDGSLLELKINRPHLELRLVTFEGQPMEGEPKEEKNQSPLQIIEVPAPEFANRWSPKARPIVYENIGTLDRPLVGRTALNHKEVAPGRFIYEWKEGNSYLVGAKGGNFDSSLQLIQVPLGSGKTALTLTAKKELPMGEVLVHIFANGKELKDVSEALLDLSLEDSIAKVVLLKSERFAKGYPYSFKAPPGRYLAVARGKEIRGHHGGLVNPRRFAYEEVEVVLVAGETRHVELHLTTGGYLEVALHGAPNASDQTAVDDYMEMSGNFWVDPEDNRAKAPALAEMRIETPNRRPESVFWSTPKTGFAVGLGHSSAWPLGTTQTSEMLPLGTYQLIASLPGGREARTTVVLRSDATTKVELWFGQ
ncbi:MAG: hypothetical protein ACI8X5_001363 [Planctomycetota bacterium]|jgi:hypothetical protein